MKKSHSHRTRHRFFDKALEMKGLWFHLFGIAAIIWFCIRVLPAPHRARYPCQQVSITVALGYIAFWSALFMGFRLWLPHARWRTSKVTPAMVIVLVIAATLSGAVFALNQQSSDSLSRWDPIPKEPIGIPQGAQPGRVVWVWDPDATADDLTGYWWQKENNDQTAISRMYSDGLQHLAGVNTDGEAWDVLFRYFNIEHEKGDVGYQPGEKIAIKINMNNGYYEPYDHEYDDIDANPYVVKALLRQLIDVVGVAQEDITVYDASRKLMNWFYNRVYYEEYPADDLVVEFPGVHFVDMDGGAPGREQVVASSERVYFAAGSCPFRTLPTVVVDAEYMINMPLMKRHVAERVTLAGKNWFGTWIEDVFSVHEYHTMGFSEMGNPAPQVDLVADERLGGNTLLLIGDATYGCYYGNSDIGKFQMYPFHDDWLSSLFFSQDSVALDSVMFDFFMVEGAGGGPSEGAQNYLHQQAEPQENLYDPENDGEYVSESLGVHEHWDPEVDIFSMNRYSGPISDGIDYIPVGEEHAVPGITITQPKERHLYVFGSERRYLSILPLTVVIGSLEVTADANGDSPVEQVEFYVDGEKMATVDTPPYIWSWDQPMFFRHTLVTRAYFEGYEPVDDEMRVWKFF